jgi:hypothetical protein
VGVVLTLPLAGCVVNRATRPTQAESARGVEASSLAQPPRQVVSSPAPVEPSHAERKDADWIAGYWHWDGVRYVWQEGGYRKRR